MAEPELLAAASTTPPSFRRVKALAPPPTKILVVEDERLVAKDIVRSLEKLGYLITGSVASSDEAVRCAAECRPDLILMDIGLKGSLDGISAAGALNRESVTPIVYLTGNSDDETLRRALETEAQGFLLKPFNERSLRATIEMALCNHGVQQMLSRANAELTEGRRELERRAHETRNLNELGEALQTCDSVDEAHAVVRRFVVRLFPDDSGVVCTLDPAHALLEAIASWGPEPPPPVFAAEECRALRLGRAYHWARGLGELACTHAAQGSSSVGLCVPMLASGEVLGVLHVQLGGPAPELKLALQELFAGSVAHQISIAIANLQLRDRLRNESIRDSLTGLFNRRYLDMTLDRELKLAVRKREPLSLLMLDLDRFKTVNDTLGHDAGDAVLRSVGEQLLGRLRSYDIACRYGGEELVIVLPRTCESDAENLANRIREEIATHPVTHNGQQLPAITVSIGLATTRDGTADATTMLRAADAALYLAKNKGRNCVAVAS